MADASRRWAWAEVDLEALAHNVAVLRRAAAPADVWAVVKADGYGHGAVRVAEAALGAGAAGLCVALVEEGEMLRRAGIDAPVLMLSEQPHGQLERSVAAELDHTVYRADTVVRLAAASAATGSEAARVHVKVDTGMQRVGAPPTDVLEVVDAVLACRPAVRLAGLCTHLAVADDPDHPMNRVQLERFDEVVEQVAARLVAAGEDPSALLVHAANSAGALAHPATRRSFVRAGIAVYGISPGPGVDHLAAELRPVMRLAARVSHVKPVRAGTGISYGLQHTFEHDTTVATVPLGYADGVPRRLGTTGGAVLVRGRRCPIVGVVTMDQLMVDVGDVPAGDAPVGIGDEVVLLGRQGDEEIRAEEWAARLDTIGYEIVCGIGQRVERIVTGRAAGSAASTTGTAGTAAPRRA
ncbi:MAG: alanine racemase [Ilumatobacteraceae bacterium]